MDPYLQAENARLSARVEGLAGEVMKAAANVDEMRRRVGEVRVTRSSADGYVTVTVDPAGRLVDISLDQRIYRVPDARGLADQILEAVTAAAEQAVRRAEQVVNEYLPSELTSGLFAELGTSVASTAGNAMPYGGGHRGNR
jgi:DNA-binding protein YbaB